MFVRNEPCKIKLTTKGGSELLDWRTAAKSCDHLAPKLFHFLP